MKVLNGVLHVTINETVAVPPRMAEALQKERRPKIIWNERLLVTENRWIFKDTVYLREEEKGTKHWNNEPDFCSDPGGSHSVFAKSVNLDYKTLLTVNYYVTCSTYKTKNSTNISLSLSAYSFWQLFSLKCQLCILWKFRHWSQMENHPYVWSNSLTWCYKNCMETRKENFPIHHAGFKNNILS